MTAIERGEIADGKTIIPLQYAYVHFFPPKRTVV